MNFSVNDLLASVNNKVATASIGLAQSGDSPHAGQDHRGLKLWCP